MECHAEQARVLIECLPYLRQFRDEVVVIKYGGHAMIAENLKRSFALNVALLKQVGIHPVIIHGGGPQIGNLLQRLDIQTTFLEGLRVTDDATMDVVEMVLVGKVNKEIVSLLNSVGMQAVGISGKDGNMIRARQMELVLTKADQKQHEIVTLGRVGEVMQVNVAILQTLAAANFIPVIAPIGADEDNETYNINADAVAGAVASALKAKRLILLTDVPGILTRDKKLIKSLDTDEAWELFADGTLQGGMIPKVKCCLEAIQEGVEKAMIIDGRIENCLLLELLTQTGIGTEIIRKS